MDKILLDSDILIDHLRGYEPARQYLKRFEVGEVEGYLSIITVAELAAGHGPRTMKKSAPAPPRASGGSISSAGWPGSLSPGDPD